MKPTFSCGENKWARLNDLLLMAEWRTDVSRSVKDRLRKMIYSRIKRAGEILPVALSEVRGSELLYHQLTWHIGLIAIAEVRREEEDAQEHPQLFPDVFVQVRFEKPEEHPA